ncbi:MAG: hypothetical protein C0504_07805 [Candidatus Solibacter sp.]|nr:hypothetical protein [Candidatus Solibacter sp.]
MLSIRLSDDELQQLKLVCQNRGARSVSDLAREAMMQMIAGGRVRNGHGEGVLLARIQELDQRLSSLQDEVSMLRSQVVEP